MDKPQPDEHNDYYTRYTALVPAGDVRTALQSQIATTVALLAAFPDGDYRYAPNKWSVKQVVGHMIDAERIFAHRAHHIARNDPKSLDGFEQDDYVSSGGFELCTLASLIEEFAAVRQATNFLFANLPPEAGTRRGTANGSGITVRAIAWIIAGHELHHREILKEKYMRASA